MNGSTKILTVSYGTFSCTLEGFDDPLGSMREIAEYFRDLAADDRYFGAEPPTPDVEMLQRIAEKEVQRRVEARVSGSGVALVAAETPEPEAEKPAPETTQPERRAARPSAEERGPLTYDDDFLMSDEPEDVLRVDPDAAPQASGPAESVAEKLRRIRAVVSRNVEHDRSAMRAEQTPNAGNPRLRDRALTETIHQIQADLADDEDAEEEPERPAPEAAADEPDWEEPREAPEARAEPEAQDEAAADELEHVEPEARAEAEPEAPVEEDDPDRDAALLQTVSQRALSGDAEPARSQAHMLSPEPEADVGRLLTEADSKLNDDETVRRRRVISQMRAAVAATKADRMVGRRQTREEAEEAEKDLYREDLSEAVESGPAPVGERKPAPPLVLVSSQRVDFAPPEPAADAEGLVAFAAGVGARELPELMEAAAAYAVFAEGQSSFTRPEIMQRVARIDPTLQLSREDSLRSFGQLLRQGTFRKLERGQFTIDKHSRYHPGARSAEA